MAAEQKQEQVPDHVSLPAPTAWPFVTAFGLALLAAGLVTQAVLSVVGLILAVRGAVGWFRDVLPVEEHELVSLRPLEQRARPVATSPRTVQQLRAGVAGHRVRIPAEIHPYSSGIKGGIAGGVAMAIVACLYGVIAQRSIWYPINLLAAAAVPSLARADLAQLTAFNSTGFIVALISHGVFSILVGLLFAVLLPMLPSARADFWGSLISPLLWSALIWATLHLINPALNARIDWIWFVASQIAFGMTTGYVVHRSKMVETMQTWPLAARAGIEAPGVMSERSEER
ncbi:MAG TPA: hypothetical protein VI585_04035 [Candidatus Binatia bacterium]